MSAWKVASGNKRASRVFSSASRAAAVAELEKQSKRGRDAVMYDPDKREVGWSWKMDGKRCCVWESE